MLGRTTIQCNFLLLLLDFICGSHLSQGPNSSTQQPCNKEEFENTNYYIIHIQGWPILRQCPRGTIYSKLSCKCVSPIYTATSQATSRLLGISYPTTTPSSSFNSYTDTWIPQQVNEIANEVVKTSNETMCNPYFRFIFDRTFLSDDKSVPSLPTNTIRFVRVPRTTGKTVALFRGDDIVTVWGMSYITFALKFKFLVRFKLLGDYKYEDKFYSLIGDGPCNKRDPHYSISVNPNKQEIHAFMKLRNKDEVDLLLSNVDLDDWVSVSLKAVNGEVIFKADSAEAIGNIGTSTIKASSCPMEIGKTSAYTSGFVGYIDTVQFNNCFGQI